MKKLFSMLLLFALCAGAVVAQTPKKIIIVGNAPGGTTPPPPITDNTLIAFINSLYTTGTVTVEFDPGRYTAGNGDTGNLGGLPQADVDNLNNADLIIISPSADSSTTHFTAELTQARWNSITTPIILMSTGRIAGNERFRWINAAATNNSSPLTLTIPAGAETNPIFTGVAVTSGTVTYYNTATPQHVTQGLVAGAGFSLLTPNSGTVLAWGSATVPFVMYWPQSATPFYTGSPYSPVANRWLANLLHIPSGGTSRSFDSIGIMTDDGKRLLKNIILSEVPAGPPPPNRVDGWTVY